MDNPYPTLKLGDVISTPRGSSVIYWYVTDKETELGSSSVNAVVIKDYNMPTEEFLWDLSARISFTQDVTFVERTIETMRLIHYMSLEHNPFNGIKSGNNVFRNPGDDNNVIYCIPESLVELRHMWFRKNKELMIILDVPVKRLSVSLMGNIHDFKSVGIRCCVDDDNAIVINGEFNPSWIKEINYCYWKIDNNNKKVVIEERINDKDFWKEGK